MKPRDTMVANKKEWIKSLGLGPSVVCIILLVFLGLILAWQHVNALSINYRINELTQKKNDLEHQRRLLLLEKASLVDYEKIEEKSRRKYGFREPEADEKLIFVVDSKQLILCLPKTQNTNQEHKGH